jgi:hypothetical protein
MVDDTFCARKTKFFLASRGIVGGLVTVGFGALMLLGYPVGPEITGEASDLGNSAVDLISETADGVVLLLAGGAALWSRIRSERRPLRAAPVG